MMCNCGVGIAPRKSLQRGLLTEDLVIVEGIDHDVLTEGIRWDWETFSQFIEAAAKRGS
jgi:N-acyl-D-amino-acid deacylase